MKISIPKPCHENWNEMLPEEKGRFCLSCQKCVLDFTELSDDEILKSVQKPNQCGRFSNQQLERINRKLKEENQIRFPRTFRYSALILALGLGGNLVAQEKEKVEIVDSTFLKATIIDSDGFPIPDAVVNLNNHNIEVHSDENGYFEMKIPDNNQKNIITITDLLGYSQEFCVADINNEIKLNYPDFELTEPIIVGLIYTERTFTGKVLRTISWPFRQIGKLF